MPGLEDIAVSYSVQSGRYHIDFSALTSIKKVYHLARQDIVVQSRPNSLAHHTYDSNNNVLSITRTPKPASGLANIVNTFTYHATFNKVATIIDGNSKTTTLSYEPVTGNLLTIQKPMVGGLTPQITYTYNARGQILTITDEAGVVTQNTYDTLTEKLNDTTVDPGTSPHFALKTSFGYDAAGNINSKTDPNNNTTTTVFDAMRRITQVTEPAPFNYVFQVIYDDNGKPLTARRQTGTTPAWQSWSFTWSVTGKQLSVSDPASHSTLWTYDGKDRLKTAQDAQGNINQFAYDALDRLSQVTDASSTVSDTRTYSTNGKLASVKDARNNTTQYAWDGHDRLSKTIYSDTTFEQNSSYDLNGNVLTALTRSGNSVVNTYDALNRLSTKTPTGQPTVTSTYDLAGKLTQISKPVVASDPSSGALQFFYDTAGRFFKEQYPDGKIVIHVLDNDGNQTKTTYPDGYFVTRGFDQLNRLSNIKLNGSASAAVQFAYDQMSHKTLVTFGNGTSITYTPQLNNDVTQIAHALVGSSVSLTYGFNNVHQALSEQISDSAFMWHPSPAGTLTYGTADNVNKYPTVGGISYSYSTNKCLTGDGTWTYTYDTENHLLTATKTGTSASFVYDPLHRQSQKTVGSVKTRFVYSGWQRIADYDGVAGTLTRRYVYGAGLDEPLIQVSSGGTLTFCHPDRLGTIVAVSNAAGALVNTNKIGPFGEVGTLGGIDVGIGGQRYDSETGLYYFKNRYFSPKIGRFLQTDPMFYADGLNLYTYVNNDPINKTDPPRSFGNGFGWNNCHQHWTYNRERFWRRWN